MDSISFGSVNRGLALAGPRISATTARLSHVSDLRSLGVVVSSFNAQPYIVADFSQIACHVLTDMDSGMSHSTRMRRHHRNKDWAPGARRF